MDAQFKARVLGWLRSEGIAASDVTSMDGYGSDWAGSTESGFYETFSVSIRYVLEDGTPGGYLDVEGERMGRLWKAVVGG